MMKFSRLILVLVTIILLAGCSSRQERAQEHLHKGDAYLAAGNDARAEVEYQTAIRNDGQLVKAYNGLASIAERKGDWQNLYRYLHKIVELQPGNTAAEVKLGDLYVAGGKISDAADLVSRLEKRVGDVADVLVLKAIVQMRQGALMDAQGTAQKALAADPGRSEAYAVLADVSLQTKNPGAALTYADKGLEFNPGDLNLQWIKLQVLRATQDRDLESQLGLSIASMHPHDGALNARLAEFLSQDNLLDPAEKILRDYVSGTGYNLQREMELISWLDQYRGAAAAETEIRAALAHDSQNVGLEFALYNVLREQKKDDAAAAALLPIISHAPDKIDVHVAKMMLATVYMDHQQAEAARKLMNQVLAEDPRQPQALLLRAGFEIDGGHFDQAVQDLRTITQEQPNSGQAWALLARVYSSLSKPDLASQSMQKAYDASGQKPKYGLMYHDFLAQHNQLSRAEDVLKAMLLKQPDYVPGLILLSRSQLDLHEFDGALATADKLETLPGTAPLPELIRAESDAMNGRLPAALDRLRKVYVQYPTDLRVVLQYVNTLGAMHEFPAAQSVVNDMLKRHLNDGTAYLLEARLREDAGDLPGAVKALRASMASNPDAPAAYRRLADLYFGLGDLVQAKNIILSGLQHVPDDHDLMLLQAEIDQINQPQAAVQEYRNLLARFPDDLVVINNLVCLLDQMPDQTSWQQAATMANRLQGTGSPNLDDTFGWASFKVGNLVNAEQSLRLAAQQLPQDPGVLYHLAAILDTAGKHNEAVDIAKQALKRVGNDEKRRNQIEKLLGK